MLEEEGKYAYAAAWCAWRLRAQCAALWAASAAGLDPPTPGGCRGAGWSPHQRTTPPASLHCRASCGRGQAASHPCREGGWRGGGQAAREAHRGTPPTHTCASHQPVRGAWPPALTRRRRQRHSAGSAGRPPYRRLCAPPGRSHHSCPHHDTDNVCLAAGGVGQHQHQVQSQEQGLGVSTHAGTGGGSASPSLEGCQHDWGATGRPPGPPPGEGALAQMGPHRSDYASDSDSSSSSGY